MTKADNVPAAVRRALILSWLPAAACMAAIFWLSSIPGDRLPMPDFRFGDKLVHFLAYSFLGALIGARNILRPWLGGTRTPIALPAFDLRGAAAGMAYGLSDEIHQLFVPLRLFGWGDMAADALGAAAGVWLLGVSWERLQGRLGSRPARSLG